MPRKTDPLAALRVHEQRTAEHAAKGKALRDEAARYLGELVIEAGLDAWTIRDLKAGLKALSENGQGGQQCLV